MSGDHVVGRQIAEEKLCELAFAYDNAREVATELKAELIEQARHLYVQYGYSARGISRLVGVSGVTVSSWLKRGR